MVDPALALLVFIGLAFVVGVLFWPGRGVVAKLLRVAEMSERVRLEDALKHLYKGEYAGRRSSVDSVAGAVEVSRSKALHLLQRLEDLGYARARGDGFALTESGRDYALHMVRTHRLLERYLADRTGVLPEDWHGEAERREHRFSPEERETLAARLGHPLYDPHGDPIPTASGELPPMTGVPVTDLAPGEAATIVHLGDEPREVYESLAQEGLSPLMILKVLDSSPGEVCFETSGREHTIPTIIARNITVERLPEAEPDTTGGETLADVGEGEVVRVLGIHASLQGPQRRRLLDLGLVPGTLVEAELFSAGKDPVAYRIRGALIALRRDQASWVQVDRKVEA
jgi:DtxR family Mn-dependent transcriptional regulator